MLAGRTVSRLQQVWRSIGGEMGAEGVEDGEELCGHLKKLHETSAICRTLLVGV